MFLVGIMDWEKKMDKSVLVIDTPQNCSECWLHREEYSDFEKIWEDICHNAEHETHVLSKTNYKRKPSWCPLKPLPEKKTHSEAEFWGNSMQGDIREIEGWNKCLKAITGETE